MAVPLDNPSYFTVSTGTLPCTVKGKFRLFQKKSPPSPSSNGIVNNNCNKMPMRTLLRSVSSNSADSNQELLVLGEPRASDIAPPSPYPVRNEQQKMRKGKKSNGDLYSPLATSEADEIEIFSEQEEDEEEEVFLTEDSAKYYNLTSSANRRHSIGAYLMHQERERDRTQSTASSARSFRDEALVHASIDGCESATQPRIGRQSRRRFNTRGASSSMSMDDIVIVSSKNSEASALWVNYFGTCFDQISRQRDRPALKVFHLGLEEANDGTGISPALEQRISSVKLNIVIICPQLLEYITTQPKYSATLCSLLKPNRTIAMLLGVNDEDLDETHHAALVSYRQWQRHPVGQDQDQAFASDFFAAAMGILAKVAKQQHIAALEERTTFSVTPKKVKQSQNRLIVLLVEPLMKDDIVRISVDRNGELMEVRPVKRCNPYTLKFTMPDRCLEVSSIVNVLVEKNGNVLGTRPVKCESRLRELDQILRSVNDPIEFMCQTLGFNPSNKEQLDGWMVHLFQKNLPLHFNLIGSQLVLPQNESVHKTPMKHPHGHEEYPTLLHFAARYGLERLAWQLLECPGGETACDIRNVCNLTPAEIAENAGHTKLASSLKGYMQMNEFTHMYSQLKELSQIKANAPDVDEDEYLLPRSVQFTYSIPPPARPYSPATHQPSNSINHQPITGYLEMQPLTKINSNIHTEKITVKNTEQPPPPPPEASLKHSTEQLNTTRSISNDSSADTYEDKVQGELLEIINDFKNNVFSLSEVEQLVENWRNRNDVQKSFKEKEEQLNLMRKEYERVQQIMKEKMKRATPFDRIKKLFSRSPKNKDQQTASECDSFETNCVAVEDKPNGDAQTHRPISSLSLQSTTSSSSSGRMSTLSGCSATSLGDSGTHSDHEDRKHLMRQTSSDHEYFEINEPKKLQNFNYLIPPAPKPIYKYSPLSKHNAIIVGHQFQTITERPPHPTPRPEVSNQGDEYYIQFPPSGLPVTAFTEMKLKSGTLSSSSPISVANESISEQEAATTDYINIPSTSIESNQLQNERLPEYMNFQPSK